MRVVRFSAFVLLIGFTALPAALRASETVEGRDVTVGQSVAMSAFLRYDRGVDGTTHVEMWEMRAGRQVQSYDIDMTKIMHLIAVSDDLSDFQHVHPILLADGHFAIDLPL